MVVEIVVEISKPVAKQCDVSDSCPELDHEEKYDGHERGRCDRVGQRRT